MRYTEETSCGYHPSVWHNAVHPGAGHTAARFSLTLVPCPPQSVRSHVNDHDAQNHFVRPSGRSRAGVHRSCWGGERFFEDEGEKAMYSSILSADRIQQAQRTMESLARFESGG